jgi:hypothetical protein
MNKKTFFHLLTASTLPIILVIILYNLSEKINHWNNNFTRLFPPHFLYNPRLLALRYNSFYLAGMSRSTIYLGNVTAPSFLLMVNYDLTDSGHLILQVPEQIKIVAPAIQVFVDSPNIFMMEGNTPRILRGNLTHPYMTDCKYQGDGFNASTMISAQSFALRTYSQQNGRNMLAKSDLSGEKCKDFPAILTTKGDGIFSLDGSLFRDQNTGILNYVYFYRNEFLSLDTNLNIIAKGKTIDTIHTPQIKLSRIISENNTTFSAPPLLVNKISCADSGFLFINSGLMANNENEDSFKSGAVVDIYSLKNGEYIYSFYVPDDNGVKMKSFQVYKHRLVALYDQSMMSFSMHY